MKLYLINIDDFWEWAKNNQSVFDSRSFEPNILGKEPEWMQEKRKADAINNKNTGGWSDLEQRRLKHYFLNGLPYKEIATRINRSENAIQKKIARGDLWNLENAS